MPKSTFIIRFTLREPDPSVPYEEQEHTTAQAAWESFRLFAEEDSSRIYRLIELVAYDWHTGGETPLAQLSFMD